MMMTGPMPAGRALEGFKVLDFSAMIAGPYCTRWLADLGADVIKVEPPEGDAMRLSPPLRDGRSSYFGHLNAGKRSAVLDLKDADAIAAIHALVRESDVLVQNFRPGVMKRLGLDWDAVREINPRLVYCSISGYGQQGEKSDRPSYAPIVQAASGHDLANFHYQDELTRPANAGLFPADILAAAYATIAIQSALLQRSRTGRGQHLDVTLMESIISIMIYEFQEAQFPSERRRTLYEPARTADGFVVVAPITQRNFENMCEAMAHPEWKTDSRLVDAHARREHWAFMMSLIREWTATRSSEDCERLLLAAGVPCSRYATLREVIADPHFRQRGSFATVDDGAGAYLVQNVPFQMSDAATTTLAAVPALGEHTAEVLRSLPGLDAARLARLVRGGTVG